MAKIKVVQPDAVYPVMVGLVDKTLTSFDNIKELLASYDRKLLNGVAMVLDKNSRRFAVNVFVKWRDAQIEEWIDLACVVWFLLMFVFLACLFLCPHDHYVDNNPYLYIMCVSAVLTLAGFLGYAALCHKKFGQWPWSKAFVTATLFTAFMLPVSAAQLLYTINSALADSAITERITKLIKKHEWHGTGKGGRPTVGYDIYFQSWRNDLDSIHISVPKSVFDSFVVGEEVTVKTRTGPFGWEYFVPYDK